MTYISQHKQSLQALECNMQMQCSEHGIKGFLNLTIYFVQLKKKMLAYFTILSFLTALSKSVTQ